MLTHSSAAAFRRREVGLFGELLIVFSLFAGRTFVGCVSLSQDPKVLRTISDFGRGVKDSLHLIPILSLDIDTVVFPFGILLCRFDEKCYGGGVLPRGG